jgi:hypothetical protein
MQVVVQEGKSHAKVSPLACAALCQEGSKANQNFHLIFSKGILGGKAPVIHYLKMGIL